MTQLSIGVLGPLEVAADGQTVEFRGPAVRRLLAALIEARGRELSRDELVERVWGEDPPSRAAQTIRTYIARLRKALAHAGVEDAIVTGSHGYALNVAELVIDIDRFEQRVQMAREETEVAPSDAIAHFDEAFSLWRGDPYCNVGDDGWTLAESARLQAVRLAAAEDRFDALLRCGRHDDAIPELEAHLAVTPDHEGFVGQLMLSLYRAGRPRDASRVFEDYLSRVHSAGLDPSMKLARLNSRIVNHDTSIECRPVAGRLGSYVIHELVGEGNFGVVYRATQANVDRAVAVKVIRAELANQPRFVRQFEREARMIAKIEHPHIVPLYDYWRDPDGAYLVMRYIDGGTLAGRIVEDGWPIDQLSRLGAEIGGELAAAHGQGVVHGDVKPSNVLLDEAGNAYLSDFGVANDSADVDAVGLSPSSEVYSSPEAGAGVTSAASDVFSLAAVAYELATGLKPFRFGRPHRELTDLLVHRPDLPAELSSVLTRATANDPAQRFEDASDFRDAFLGAVDNDSRE